MELLTSSKVSYPTRHWASCLLSNVQAERGREANGQARRGDMTCSMTK